MHLQWCKDLTKESHVEAFKLFKDAEGENGSEEEHRDILEQIQMFLIAAHDKWC